MKKALPHGNDIWTRAGKRINPLNVQPDDLSIIDVVHGLPRIPKYGAQSASFYSYAEHSVNMYDYFETYFDAILEKFERPASKKAKKGLEDDRKYISDIKKRHLKLFTLLHFSAFPYLIAILEGFQAPSYHIPRITAGILHGIGLDYEEYKLCNPMLNYIHTVVDESVLPSFNAKSDKYLFLPPHRAQEEFIHRFNRDSDIEIRTIGHTNHLVKPQAHENGQFHMCFDLPTIAV